MNNLYQDSLAAVLLILFVAVWMCLPANVYAAPKAQEVSIEEAMTAWQSKEAVFIDVRTPEEYHEGHVPGAVLLPLSDLENRYHEITKDKAVYLICHSGRRSAAANIFLQQKGFTNTKSVVGGILAWREQIEK